jgi:tetratricopeptide (TPR) repeat protein
MTEMKLFLRFIHKSFLLILVVLVGCPTTPDTLLNQGIKHLNKGQYDKAILDFTKAIEIKPSAEAYFRRGIAYDDKADSEVLKGIEIKKIDPKSADAYNRRSSAYVDKAISDFNKAIELNPEYAEAYNKRAMGYFKKGKNEEAFSDLTKVIEISPSAEAYELRGWFYFLKGQRDKGVADFHKAYKAYELRWQEFRKKDQDDKANPDRNKAMEKHYLEAISSREKGQMAKACIRYQQACELGFDAACGELDMLEEEGLCRRLINVMK